MRYYSATKKNGIMPSAVTWMIILREITQKEKDIYHIYVESKKKKIQMNLFTKRNRLTDMENRPVVANGERVGE